MGTLQFGLMEIFLIFIQQTLLRIFSLKNGYLASTGLDCQSSDETQLLSTRKQTVDNVQIKDQELRQGDQVLIIHMHKQL